MKNVPENTKRMLNKQEAARYLGVGYPTFLKMIDNGEIAVQHPAPRTYRIAVKELDRWIDGGERLEQN